MITALSIAILGAASVFDAPFQRGNDAYEAGDYQAAIQAYEQLVAEGVEDESLFYNLGNSYFRSGNKGAAILNFERALRLNPTHAQSRQNLDHVIAQTPNQALRPLPPPWEQSLLMWHYTWSPYSVYVAAIACWWAFWLLLAMRLWKPNRWITRGAVIAALATLAFTTSSYAKAFAPPLAVALKDNIPVQYAIGESQTVNFELMEGDRVVIEKTSGDWFQVLTADGQRGWANSIALGMIGPPYSRPQLEFAAPETQSQ